MDWPLVRLDSLYNIARGGSPRPIKDFITDDPEGINWIKIGDATASGKYIYTTKQKIKPEGIQRSRLVKENDFLLSNSMSFGRPYIMGTTGCIHDGWLVLSAKDKQVDQDFLYHLLGSPFVFLQFDSLAAGSTVRNLNIDLVSGVKIPLIPIPEQQRIVAILDQAFADIEKARANAEKNLKNARELFDSYLNQVFSQRGEGWVESELGKLGQITSSKRIFKSEYVDAGVPFFRTKEIKQLANGKTISTELFISEEKYNQIKTRFDVPAVGDVLITAIGTIGEIYVVDNAYPFYFKDGNVLWLKQFNTLKPQFLKYALMAFVSELNRLSRGAAYNALPIQKLKCYVISFPQISEQDEVISKIDAIKDESQKLVGIYSQKIASLEELKKSLLQKAFSGELTKTTGHAA
ncbi:restriction endonuclease subunit S [Porticoccaceae bacterium]|nr:restriction endonuclease subunit S [Porticoccaceae bacterium]